MVDRDALDFLKSHIGSDTALQRALGWPKDNQGQVIANWRKRGVPLHSRGAILALLKKHKARADMVASFERITSRAMGRLHGPTTTRKGNGHGGKGDKARQVKRKRVKPEGGQATASASGRAGS